MSASDNALHTGGIDSPEVDDSKTASAFASSWNNLPSGSVYSHEQFVEWFEPLTEADARDRRVLELGCGNGSLLVHMAGWQPTRLEGVDLGDSVLSARANMDHTGHANWQVHQADLTAFDGANDGGNDGANGVANDGFDLVYCIGVLHHLNRPRDGFDAVVRNTRPGGRFHCWVYAHEGNAVIRWLVEPLRRVCSRLPWWLTKYLVATPLVAPYFIYAKLLARLPKWRLLQRLPLYAYSQWIATRGYGFFRHVAFDQLVTPSTVYLKKETIESWLSDVAGLEPDSSYLVWRNGNSWKFGGRLAAGES